MDPRITIISERLRHVKRVIAVSSGKGGVGKSLVASTLALILARKNYKIGLFDLDFTSPSTHAILGVKEIRFKEEKGIVPTEVHGFKYVSIVAYSCEETLPLRGADVSNALIELFAVTRWGPLDFLILDMPPGISDATLDLIKLVKGTAFLIVTTPSQLAFETVKKLVKLLVELKVPVVGILKNMEMNESPYIKQQVTAMGFPFLGEIPFDPKVEEALGHVDALMETVFARKLAEAISNSPLLQHCSS